MKTYLVVCKQSNLTYATIVDSLESAKFFVKHQHSVFNKHASNPMKVCNIFELDSFRFSL